jgi:hypothetical protein
MSNSEEYLAEYDLGDLRLSTAVHQPLLGDFTAHLSFSIERQAHFVHSLQQLCVLNLRYGTLI